MNKQQKFVLAAGALGAAALYHGIVTRTYMVRTAKLARGQKFRIALLADLHSHIYGGDQSPLLHKIWAGAPDAVFLAGDIYDNHAKPEGVRMLLDGLRGMPMWYTPGNHEHRTARIEEVCEFFASRGVRVLLDAWERAEIGGVPVTIAGADDPERAVWLDTSYDHVAAKARAFADLPKERFSILNAHKPEHIGEYQRYPFDLVLSGHAHGGQVRVPGLCNGVFASGQGWLPQYPGGRYEHDALTHIVSRGLSVYWYIPRVCNPPELVFVDVVGV